MRDSQQRRRPRFGSTAVLAAALSLTAAQASVGREPAPLTIGQGQAPRPPATGAGTSTSSTTAQPAPTTSTTTTTTIPAGSGVLDDTAFTYAPTSSTEATGWVQYGPGLDAAAEDYGHGNHTTKAANASATLAFEGNGITIFGGKGADFGLLSVSVDGQPKVEADAYAPSWLRQQPLVTLSGLGSGQHRLTVTALGRHSAKASDTYVVLDKAVIETGTGDSGVTPLCSGGTRVEAESAIPSSSGEVIRTGSGGWLFATTPAGYSGAGFMSNDDQSGYLWIPFHSTAPYYEVRTRSITGGAGATRGHTLIGPIAWPIQNTWSVATIGTWPANSGRAVGFGGDYFVLGPMTTRAWTEGPYGYLGIDYVDFCPLERATIPVVITNGRSQPVVLFFGCVSAGTSLTAQVIVPGTFGPLDQPPLAGQASIDLPQDAVCSLTSVPSGVHFWSSYYDYVQNRVRSTAMPPLGELFGWSVQGAVRIYVTET